MNASTFDPAAAPPRPAPVRIEIIEPESHDCFESVLPPEGHVKLRNYRLAGPAGSLRVYSPSGDAHTTPAEGELVPRYDDFVGVSPPRRRILELLRPDDPGRDALEAIVRPAPRRPRAACDDVDGVDPDATDAAWNFTRCPPLSPSPTGLSGPSPEPPALDRPSRRSRRSSSDEDFEGEEAAPPSLADELRAAELGGSASPPPGRPPPRRVEGARREAPTAERERLARLALAVEEDEAATSVAAAQCGLAAAARQLDLMLAESRDLHTELAEIHDDMQAETRRAAWCAAAARALRADTRAMCFLDDVLALLRGDVAGAMRARSWPFALGGVRRDPAHNYIV